MPCWGQTARKTLGESGQDPEMAAVTEPRPAFASHSPSGEYLLNYLSPVDCDDLLAVVVLVKELVLIDAQGVQDGRVQVVGVDGPLHGDEADRVGGADHLASLDPAAGQPHGVSQGRVVAPGLGADGVNLGCRR